MVTLHAFLALLAGFATIAIFIVLATALLRWLTPGWGNTDGRPSPGYVVVHLGYSFLSAAAGGYVTAWAATANPLQHVLVLAIAVLVLAALGALQSRGKQQVLFQLAMIAIAPIGVLAGGLARMRVLGIL
jgi:hypothetical protein